jgi:hypothetical protein
MSYQDVPHSIFNRAALKMKNALLTAGAVVAFGLTSQYS